MSYNLDNLYITIIRVFDNDSNKYVNSNEMFSKRIVEEFVHSGRKYYRDTKSGLWGKKEEEIDYLGETCFGEMLPIDIVVSEMEKKFNSISKDRIEQLTFELNGIKTNREDYKGRILEFKLKN